MRIITGKYKGRVIKMPKGIRPTQGLVRKALFDILGDIAGLSFLELFAGSGAIGIEAWSQGAKEVVFVEKDRRCIEKIKQNLSVLGFSPACRPPAGRAGTGRGSRLPAGQAGVLGLDAWEAIEQLGEAGGKFDIIFLDPPYSQDLAKKTLQTLSGYDILAPNGLVIVQHFKKDNLPEALGDLKLFKQAKYGDTVLSFYKHA